MLLAQFYVGLPILLVGVLDQDISAADCVQYPALYQDGIFGRYLNRRKFVYVLLRPVTDLVGCFFMVHSR